MLTNQDGELAAEVPSAESARGSPACALFLGVYANTDPQHPVAVASAALPACRATLLNFLYGSL